MNPASIKQSGAFFVIYRMQKPSLNNALFWDTDIEKIDWELNADAIIVRVLERGDLNDFREIRRAYGDEAIKKTAMTAKYLSARTLSFASFFFEIPKTDFACFRNRPYQIPLLSF